MPVHAPQPRPGISGGTCRVRVPRTGFHRRDPTLRKIFSGRIVCSDAATVSQCARAHEVDKSSSQIRPLLHPLFRRFPDRGLGHRGMETNAGIPRGAERRRERGSYRSPLWRLQHGNLAGPQPKAVVLLIVTNDLAYGRSPELTADGIRANLEVLRERLPAARILLLGLLPREESPSAPLRLEVAQVNQLIRDCGDGEHIYFAEIGEVLLDRDG